MAGKRRTDTAAPKLPQVTLKDTEARRGKGIRTGPGKPRVGVGKPRAPRLRRP
jgi:hypothetical protein